MTVTSVNVSTKFFEIPVLEASRAWIL